MNSFKQWNDGAAASARGHLDSDPDTWLLGSSKNFFAIDAMITVAADLESDLRETVTRVFAEATSAGAQTHCEEGKTLPGDRVGHEHFGFKDGVSQPAVLDFDLAGSDGFALGRPGVRMVAASQFLLNYETDTTSSDWMRNGSFVVYRRLVQDVAGFWQAVSAKAESIGISADALAAKLMGRWRNGAPVVTSVDGDPGSIRNSDNDNVIAFGSAEGADKCPFASHIRKMNPREDLPEGATPRILRRGIPFGDPYDPAETSPQQGPRGLHFVCYASSLGAFEVLQYTWANSPDFPMGGGPDAIIRSTDPAEAEIQLAGLSAGSFSFGSFVTNTGALYAFAPTISGLTVLANGDVLP